MAGTPTTTTSSPSTSKDYWRDKESPRLSIGQKKTLSGFTTTIDDYDKHDDTDYEAIAKEMKEEEDREAAASKSLHPRYGKIRTGVTEPVSKSLPRNESGGTATSSSRHSRESRNPEDHEASTSKPPLPQGDVPAPAKAGGWGEGSQKLPFIPYIQVRQHAVHPDSAEEPAPE